jgi:hypothetical protein
VAGRNRTDPRLMKSILSGRVALAGALAVSLIAPAAASADSIVYIKDHNVWLSQPDGAKQTQVTTDGTFEYPYRSPSQADNGTIAASLGTNIVVLEQNGNVVRKLDPPALVDSVSHPIDGVPVDVAISPDAARIAYSFASYSCPVGASCAARTATSVTDADKVVPPSTYGQVVYGDPSWVSGSRLMLHGGYLSQNNLWDLGQADRFHWFDDQDWAGQGNSTDLGDADLSRDGRLWVGVRGYDSDVDNHFRRVIWAKTNGNPGTDTPPPTPEATCLTEEGKGTNGPSIAPSGDAFAYARPDGILVFRGVSTDPARCGEAADSLVLPGGSEPDWGPADVNPQPRGTGDNGGNNNGGNSGGDHGDGGAGPKASVKVSVTRLKSACRSGLKVRLANVPAGRQTIVIRRGKTTVGKRGVKVGRSGAGAFVVKFSRSGQRSVCNTKARSVKLTVTAAGAKRVVALKR